MPRKKSVQLDIAAMPYLPAQEEFDWLLEYIEKRNDPLYSVVFLYQVIDVLLRVLIIKKTGRPETADVESMEELVNVFDMQYLERGDLVQKIRRWKSHRNTIMHEVLFSEAFHSGNECDAFITATAQEGDDILSTLLDIVGDTDTAV